MSATEQTARPAGTAKYSDMSREELYELAQERDIDGRSQMSKDELEGALALDDRGPDAVALLQRQHDAIREKFDRFEALSARPSQRKQDLVREIVTDLVKHAEIEEQVFYPAVRDAIESGDSQVDQSLEEHHVAELLLAELDHLTPDADRYDAKVRVLMDDVREHMAEEEAEVFPAVREAIDEERRRDMGRAMVDLWQMAPTRPHPASPDTPPANLLVAIPTAAWDLGVGVVRAAWRSIKRR